MDLSDKLQTACDQMLEDVNQILLKGSNDGKSIARIQDEILSYQAKQAQRGFIPEFSIDFNNESLTLEHLTIFDIEDESCKIIFTTRKDIQEGSPLPKR